MYWYSKYSISCFPSVMMPRSQRLSKTSLLNDEFEENDRNDFTLMDQRSCLPFLFKQIQMCRACRYSHLVSEIGPYDQLKKYTVCTAM